MRDTEPREPCRGGGTVKGMKNFNPIQQGGAVVGAPREWKGERRTANWERSGCGKAKLWALGLGKGFWVHGEQRLPCLKSLPEVTPVLHSGDLGLLSGLKEVWFVGTFF